MQLWALPQEALQPVHVTHQHVSLHGVLAIPTATTHDPTMSIVWQQGDPAAAEVHEQVLMYLCTILDNVMARGRAAAKKGGGGGAEGGGDGRGRRGRRRADNKSVQRYARFLLLHMQTCTSKRLQQHNTKNTTTSFSTQVAPLCPTHHTHHTHTTNTTHLVSSTTIVPDMAAPP